MAKLQKASKPAVKVDTGPLERWNALTNEEKDLVDRLHRHLPFPTSSATRSAAMSLLVKRIFSTRAEGRENKWVLTVEGEAIAKSAPEISRPASLVGILERVNKKVRELPGTKNRKSPVQKPGKVLDIPILLAEIKVIEARIIQQEVIAEMWPRQQRLKDIVEATRAKLTLALSELTKAQNQKG